MSCSLFEDPGSSTSEQPSKPSKHSSHGFNHTSPDMLLATDQDPMHVSAHGTTSHQCLFHMAQSPCEEALFRDNDVLVLSCFVKELPLMSTAAGSAGYPVGQSYSNDHGMINLDVRTLTGEEFRLRVERSTRGSELRKMVLDHLPGRSGAKLVLDYMRHQTSEQVEETVRLKLHQTLQEQGLAEAETAILCCTYVPAQLQAAWCFLRRLQTSEAELSLEGVTHLKLTTESRLHHNLPIKSLISLISLTYGDRFRPSLTICRA